jgi:hypothetical protein
MHGTFADFDPASSDHPGIGPPLVLEQAPEGGGRFVLAAVSLPVLVTLMVPFWLVVAQLVADPAARAVLMARPLLGLELAAGMLAVAAIFGWPLASLVGTALGRRRITIGNGTVHSELVGRIGKSSWTEPIGAYAGLTQRVRTSLSGVRHELVLVHPRPSRSVILQSGPQVSPEAMASAARLFAFAEIPSREAASFAPAHGYFGLAELKPQWMPG